MALPNDVIIEIYDNDINQMDDVCFNRSNVSQTRAQRMKKALKLKMKQFVSMMSKPKPLLITLCCFALLLVNVYIKTALYSKVNHEKTNQSRALLCASNNLVEWVENAGKAPPMEEQILDLDQLWERGLVSIVGKNEKGKTVCTYYVRDLKNGKESVVMDDDDGHHETELIKFVAEKMKSKRTKLRPYHDGDQVVREWRKLNFLQEWIDNPYRSWTGLLDLLKSGEISVLQSPDAESIAIRDKTGQCLPQEIKPPHSGAFMLMVQHAFENQKIMRLVRPEYGYCEYVKVHTPKWFKPKIQRETRASISATDAAKMRGHLVQMEESATRHDLTQKRVDELRNDFVQMESEKRHHLMQIESRKRHDLRANEEVDKLRVEHAELERKTHGQFNLDGQWADDVDLDGGMDGAGNHGMEREQPPAKQRAHDDGNHGMEKEQPPAERWADDDDRDFDLPGKQNDGDCQQRAEGDAAKVAEVFQNASHRRGDVDGYEKAEKQPLLERCADDFEMKEKELIDAAPPIGAPTGTKNPPLPGAHQQILTGDGWMRRSEPRVLVPNKMMYGQKTMKHEQRKKAMRDLRSMVHKEAEGVLNEKEIGYLQEFLKELTTHGDPATKKSKLKKILGKMVVPDARDWTQNGIWSVPRFTKRIVMYWYVERVIEDYQLFSDLDVKDLEWMRQTYQRMRIRLEGMQEGHQKLVGVKIKELSIK